jgi:hypothetical protein
VRGLCSVLTLEDYRRHERTLSCAESWSDLVGRRQRRRVARPGPRHWCVPRRPSAAPPLSHAGCGSRGRSPTKVPSTLKSSILASTQSQSQPSGHREGCRRPRQRFGQHHLARFLNATRFVAPDRCERVLLALGTSRCLVSNVHAMHENCSAARSRRSWITSAGTWLISSHTPLHAFRDPRRSPYRLAGAYPVARAELQPLRIVPDYGAFATGVVAASRFTTPRSCRSRKVSAAWAAQVSTVSR